MPNPTPLDPQPLPSRSQRVIALNGRAAIARPGRRPVRPCERREVRELGLFWV